MQILFEASLFPLFLYIILPLSTFQFGERWWCLSAYPHKGIAWSQKEKSRAASRPQPNKNHISYIPQSLRGLRYFFCSTDFFLFSGSYPSSGKNQQPSARAFWCVRFYFVGKCGFLVFPGGTSLPCCRGPPSVWTSSRNSDETEVHSVDAGKKKNMGSRPTYRGHG